MHRPRPDEVLELARGAGLDAQELAFLASDEQSVLFVDALGPTRRLVVVSVATTRYYDADEPGAVRAAIEEGRRVWALVRSAERGAGDGAPNAGRDRPNT